MVKCTCDACDWTGDESELATSLGDCPDLGERLDVGSVVPAGECPECGCFAYLDKPEPVRPDPMQTVYIVTREACELTDWETETEAFATEAEAMAYAHRAAVEFSETEEVQHLLCDDGEPLEIVDCGDGFRVDDGNDVNVMFGVHACPVKSAAPESPGAPRSAFDAERERDSLRSLLSWFVELMEEQIMSDDEESSRTQRDAIAQAEALLRDTRNQAPTPGPWDWKSNLHDPDRFSVWPADVAARRHKDSNASHVVADFYGPDAQGNAIQAAAAPAMVALLREMIHGAAIWSNDQFGEWLNRATDVFNEATNYAEAVNPPRVPLQPEGMVCLPREVARRAVLWLGRCIAEGAHKECVLPRSCEVTAAHIQACIDGGSGNPPHVRDLVQACRDMLQQSDAGEHGDAIRDLCDRLEPNGEG
jgi:hypothetical protein